MTEPIPSGVRSVLRRLPVALVVGIAVFFVGIGGGYSRELRLMFGGVSIRCQTWQWNPPGCLYNLHAQRSATLKDQPSRVDDRTLELVKGLRVESAYFGFLPITDRGLQRFSGMQTIRTLFVPGTDVTDRGLGVLRGLDNLEYLNLEFTRVSDKGLENLVGLKRLWRLSLMGTFVSGRGLAHLSGLSSLEELVLSSTSVRSEDLAVLVSLPKLRELYLSGTKIDDAAAVYLVKMPKLEALSVENTDVTSNFIEDLSGATRLRKLNVTSTRVTASARNAVCRLNLERLNARGTPLEGIDCR